MYRYAATAVTFMITARTTRALFSEDTVKVADSKLQVSTVHLSYNWFSTIITMMKCSQNDILHYPIGNSHIYRQLL